MKIPSLKTIAVSALAICFLSACNKYEDGPSFSLASRKSRMVNNWRIDKAYDNGDDVTSSYNRYELDLGKSGSARLSQSSSFGGFIITAETNGSWSFTNDMEDLSLNFEDNDFDETYTILKLERSELWIREKGDDLELHLTPR